MWQEQELNNWADFVEFIDKLKIEQDDTVWVFRGQSDARWKLEPSLLRQINGTTLTVKRALGIESGLTHDFKRQYHLHSKADGINRSDWGLIAWWILMQHHCCPTRLLDWTFSPYVALYFAVEQLPDKDGAIWLFPSPSLEEVVSKKWGEFRKVKESIFETDEIKAVYPIIGTHDNERSAPQQSVFTLGTHILSDHETVIRDVFLTSEKMPPLYKVILPSKLKDECLARLRIMNITASSLFPGLDGLGRAGRDYARLRVWNTQNENKEKSED